MDKRTRLLAALERQIARLERGINELQRQADTLTNQRVIAFIVGLIVAVFAFNIATAVGWAAVALWIALFGLLVRRARRVNHSIARFKSWQQIKATHLARMRLHWDRLPPATATAPRNHPFALDIDIVGPQSMHRLLDTSVSRGGSTRLLDWLLELTPDLDTIHARQQQIRELIPMSRFRDGLSQTALLSEHRGQWDGRQLLDWLRSDATPGVPPLMLAVLFALSAINIILIVLDALSVLPRLWPVTFVLYALLSVYQWRKLSGLFGEALTLKSELDKLQSVLRYLETYPYGDRPALKAVVAPFITGSERPSRQLRQLGQVLAAASLQANVIFWLVVNLLVPWDIFFASRLSKSKGELGRLVPRWLDAWYEVEALNALATFAHLNPEFIFPTVDPSVTTFEGTTLGHPLIPAELRVNNDFRISAPGEVVILTGSNMSGKSSFLRTVGVNMRLAYMGSVVAAGSLHTGLFRLYTCIRVTDSVVDGISYFYAEVRRLRDLLGELNQPEQPPLFFLIDEIFRGTNNRERLEGSRSYIKALTGSRGCGMISTHDLELVTLADALPKISNYHFREHIRDQRMVFDYQLRPGPSPTTNALKIMALEGLPVDPASV